MPFQQRQKPHTGRPQKYRVGDTLGRLTIESDSHPSATSPHMRILHCRCDCGNLRDVPVIYAPRTTACEVHDPDAPRYKGTAGENPQLTPAQAEAHRIFNRLRVEQRRLGLPFDINVNHYDKLIAQPCHYCQTTPAGHVDAKIHTKGHTQSNTVPACRQCDRAKGTLTPAEFAEWLERFLQ